MSNPYRETAIMSDDQNAPSWWEKKKNSIATVVLAVAFACSSSWCITVDLKAARTEPQPCRDEVHVLFLSSVNSSSERRDMQCSHPSHIGTLQRLDYPSGGSNINLFCDCHPFTESPTVGCDTTRDCYALTGDAP